MPRELTTKANREVVVEGVDRLRLAYQAFMEERQKAGYDFQFVDGQMIAHNFLKLVIYNIADEIQAQKSLVDKEVVRRALMRIAIATLQRAVEQPITNETDPDLS